MKYERLISEAMQQPWVLTPRYLAIIQDLLRFRAAGGRLTAEELQARIGAEDERPRVQARGGAIAVIPIHGVIAHRTFDASSGMTSAEAIGMMVDRAVADEEVHTILLDCCTPGGTSVGCPEVATKIFQARKTKYVSALVNGEMHSAGYWLGSQAHEIVSIPSAYCGSIGVWTLVEDWSEHLAKEGIKIEFIHAGDNKYEGSRFWEPLSDETRAHLQDQVDKIYTAFLAAVARGRDRTATDVKKNFGQGRVFDAREALERGLIDRIATVEDTLTRLSTRAKTRSRAQAQVETPVEAPIAEASLATATELTDDTPPVGPDAGRAARIASDRAVLEEAREESNTW